MARARHVLAIDQGTTSTRAIVFDRAGAPVAQSQRELEQHYPRAGWVEHDPETIWQDTLAVCREALAKAGLERRARSPRSASPTSARPWCCGSGRAASRCTARSSGRTGAPPSAAARSAPPATTPWCSARTGLLIDPYFSATKLAWLLDEVAGARAGGRARRAGVRHHRFVPALAAHRRRGARDRRDQRRAHHALRHPSPGLGRRAAAAPAHSAGGPAGGQGLQRAVRRHLGRPVRRAAADHRHRRRPAGGDRRPGVLRAGHAEEHLRHRLLRAVEHRRDAGRLPPPPAHDDRLSARAARPPTRSRAASSSPAPRCSGCATA